MLRTLFERETVRRHVIEGELMSSIAKELNIGLNRVFLICEQYKADLRTLGVHADQLPESELKKITGEFLDRAHAANERLGVYKKTDRVQKKTLKRT